MAGNGKSAGSYYAAAQNLPDAFLRGTFSDNGLSEDEVRAIQANARESRIEELLGNNSGSIDGRIERGAALANRRRGERQDKARAKARNSDTVLMAILEMESDLAARYGEGFAGDLLADLCAKGLIEDDEYARIMAIEDDTERRRAIAMRIQEGLDNGTIKPDDLQDHPWAREWLDKHKQATTEMTRQAASYQRGEVGVDDIEQDAKFQAASLEFAQGGSAANHAEEAADSHEQSQTMSESTEAIADSFRADGLNF